MLGAAPPQRPRLPAQISRKVLSPMGEDEYMRVKVGKVGERMIATPLSRGAGVIMSLVRADGIVRIPRLSEGLHPGAEVEVELLRPASEVERTIVAIGSHDLTLDLLSSRLSAAKPGVSLSSSNVGSLGGIIALQRGEAHLAGSHLLDETSGEYNVDYVRRMLPNRRVVIMTLVLREQGLILPKGNPKGIASLEDLLRDDVLFVNRQKGAGTRVLLDYQLRQRELDPVQINGYEREEYTHLAVAATVASGAADVGLGILAAARALNLDFQPLLQERYDLLIPAEFWESELLAPMLEIIRGPDFRREVEALGGYDVSPMGQVVAEL
jgi:putative molybdopterin biosynthesis protein